MQNENNPELVGIVISKKGMNDLVKNIYINNEITDFFKLNFKLENNKFFNTVKVTKNLLEYIFIPEDKSSNLEDILNRKFDITIVSLYETDIKLFDKNNTPEIVFSILKTYYARINRSNCDIVRSDKIDYS